MTQIRGDSETDVLEEAPPAYVPPAGGVDEARALTKSAVEQQEVCHLAIEASMLLVRTRR